jgi:hypothetical protein
MVTPERARRDNWNKKNRLIDSLRNLLFPKGAKRNSGLVLPDSKVRMRPAELRAQLALYGIP